MSPDSVRLPTGRSPCDAGRSPVCPTSLLALAPRPGHHCRATENTADHPATPACSRTLGGGGQRDPHRASPAPGPRPGLSKAHSAGSRPGRAKMQPRPTGTGALTRQTVAFVLAGGRGSRLEELTDRRAKPAVYFGGKSRIIDFALSNALNSGIRRIGVATQYKAHSLIRHLQRGWNFFRVERNESFDILPASQRVTDEAWYAGTADAVYQNIDIIESYGP